MADIIKLFANCIPVKGAQRSTICDLQRNNVFLIPNSMYMLFDNNGNLSTEKIGNLEDHNIIMEYVAYLLENELADKVTDIDKDCFPRLNTHWDFPATISNAVIDIDVNKFSIDVYKEVFLQLIELQCYYVQIRILSPFNKVWLFDFIETASQLKIRNIEILMSALFIEDFNNVSIDLVNMFSFISRIVLFSCDEDKVIQQGEANTIVGTILNVANGLENINQCGNVSQIYFSPNIPHFTESLHHNTCLNRKISIDAEGNIKNCPSMKESFGNIKDTTLLEAIQKPGFKKYWNIKKDDIAVCKDCEFRHICTDCRAYVENPEDMYSKPLKCGYNPYTCEWEEWSTNPLKQKAIEYYGMQELVKNNNDKQ